MKTGMKKVSNPPAFSKMGTKNSPHTKAYTGSVMGKQRATRISDSNGHSTVKNIVSSAKSTTKTVV